MEVQDQYGTSQISVRAPGRVNLIGEHTDYNDGYVMPVAIDMEIRVHARRREDHLCRLYSEALQQEAQFDLENLQVDELPLWARYPAGVASMLRLHTQAALSGIDAVIVSTLPTGSGLSSSAAFESAFAVLWNELDDLGLDGWTLAKLCQQAEHAYAGVKCGIMDQAASLLCEAGHALFLDTRTLETKQVPLPEDWVIVVADTGKPRMLSGSEYNQRRADCEHAVRLLDQGLAEKISALRDVSPEGFMQFAPGLLPEIVRKRVAHVVGENLRVSQFVKALRERNAREVGLLMNASHASLRDDYEVSCPELDCMQQLCLQVPGCVGARMTGAGFGGACVALVSQEGVGSFIEEVGSRYRALQPYQPAFYLCRAVTGAGRMGGGS